MVNIMFSNENWMKIWFNMVHLLILGTWKGIWPGEIFYVAKKKAIFGSIPAFYSIRAVITLTVVDSGSQRLHITKKISDIQGIEQNWMAN